MCGWECIGCWRGYCRVVGGARRALNRFVVEECLIRWLVSISRICLLDSHVNCFLLLCLLFTFRSSGGESTEGSSQAREIVPKPT